VARGQLGPGAADGRWEGWLLSRARVNSRDWLASTHALGFVAQCRRRRDRPFACSGRGGVVSGSRLGWEAGEDKALAGLGLGGSAKRGKAPIQKEGASGLRWLTVASGFYR